MAKQFFAALCVTAACMLVLGTCTNGVQGYPGQAAAMVTEYAIIVDPKLEHGTLTVSRSLAPEGTMIRVYANPYPGYTLKSGSIRWASEGAKLNFEPIDKFGYYYQSMLGANNRIVAATFEPNPSGVTVSVDRNLANGIIAADPISAAPGTPVQLYVVPKEGYVLKDNSFSIKDAAGNTLAVPVNEAVLPYNFTVPAANAVNMVVSAEFVKTGFNGYLASARKHIQAGQFDTAAAFYEEAYQAISGGTGNDAQEAIFYSTLSQLGKILLDTNVRALFKSVFFDIVPTSLDDWICDPATWGGGSGDRWYDIWDGQTYDSSTAAPGTEPTWAESINNSPEWAKDIQYESRDTVLPNRFGRISGFHVSFSDTPLYQATNPKTAQKFYNLLFWALITSNPDGFNDLLMKADVRLFGAQFEAAAARAATLSSTASVTLYSNLKTRFGLGKYYDPVSPKVGKAELDYIFGVLRAVKAAVQFLRAYDWAIDLRPWTGLPMEPITPSDGLDQILDSIFSDSEGDEYTRWKSYWLDSATVTQALPFKNRYFMTMRDSAYLDKSKNSLSKALAMINSSMTYWHGSGSNFSPAAKTNYKYAKDAFAQAQKSLNGAMTEATVANRTFYLPRILPLPGSGASWPARASDAAYGIDIKEFFAPEAFKLQNLFTTEMNGAAPSMYKLRWYMDGSGNPVITGATHTQPRLVTAPITDNGRETVGTFSAPYGIWSFEVNTGHLRKIFPTGFKQDKYGRKTGDKAYLYEVFPTIPLWPARPTYFIGKDGIHGEMRSAKNLYKYYH